MSVLKWHDIVKDLLGNVWSQNATVAMKQKYHLKGSLKGFEVSSSMYSTKFNSKNINIDTLIQPINFVKILQDNLKWILCYKAFFLKQDIYCSKMSWK